jgi:hypothetical protein
MNRPLQHLPTAVCLIGCSLLHQAVAAPNISALGQPKDYSVSLGANVTHSVSATTANPPLTYQWRFNDSPLPEATTRQWAVLNAQPEHAGGYSVVVTDSTGSVTSRAARLEVDPTFTKITTGPLATDPNRAQSATWADFDNDNDMDLLLPGLGEGRTAYYRNDGGGVFTRLTDTTKLPFLAVRQAGLAPCGDFNNDGFMDFVLYLWDPWNPDALSQQTSVYWGHGDSTFSKGPSLEPHWAWNTVVLDFDQDGFLDLFLGRDSNKVPLLLRGDGKGGFVKQTADAVGPLLDPGWEPRGMAFADYDDDGLLDVFAAYSNSSPKTNLLFRGVGGGRFERVIHSAVRHTGFRPMSAAWGDINNDGRLDLLVANHKTPDGVERAIGIYVNRGEGTFEDVTTSAFPANPAGFTGFISLADYDNDGYLDAYTVGVHPRLVLHNQGDGTFRLITSGSLVNDPMNGGVAPWMDFDNDGFVDLYLANYESTPVAPGYLYRNNGNANHWLKLKPVGTTSNRMGAGAKFRVKTIVDGRVVWQRRDISAGDPWNGSHLNAHFGLGKATHAVTVRVEWPSGIVQELTDVAADQSLTVVEPARIWLACTIVPAGIQVRCHGLAQVAYELQVSDDLKTWGFVGTMTSPTGTSEHLIPRTSASGASFYRAVAK